MHIEIAALTYRRWNIYTQLMIDQVVKVTKKAGHRVGMRMILGSSVVHNARNSSVKQLDPTADYYLFCDDDMLPGPDALLQLLERAEAGHPIVSALCTSRSIPITFSFFMWDKDRDVFLGADAVSEQPAFLTGPFGFGCAFMLVKASTFWQMHEDFLSANCWARDIGGLALGLGADPARIERYRRALSSARRKRWKQEGLTQLFDFDRCRGIDAGLVTHDDAELLMEGITPFQLTEQFSEDLSFCRRALKMGVLLSIDTGVRVCHLGNYAYGPHNFGQSFDSGVLFKSGVPMGYSPAVVEVMTEPSEFSGVIKKEEETV